MQITIAQYEDLPRILELQYLAYQSEAELLNNYDIPPLKQSLSEIQQEYAYEVFLKAMEQSGIIIGSVRAYRDGETVHIGKLIVHPEHRNKGIGTAMLHEIEIVLPSNRYELFTSDKSEDNLKLYQKLGYEPFKEQIVTQALRFIFLQKR